jgi:16S rRNA (guanine966-N2)-methyltransferase
MRIIAGTLGGRTFESPHGRRTHPMSDKVRGSLFNTLGDIDGLTILDAFAGSGALAFEAISRGAEHVLAIEIDNRAQDTIARNIKTLGLARAVKLVRANCSGWSDNNPDAQFDIVIAAPPYDDLQLSVVEKMVRHVCSDGLFVLDWPGKIAAPELPGLAVIANKNYGDAQLVFYR